MIICLCTCIFACIWVYLPEVKVFVLVILVFVFKGSSHAWRKSAARADWDHWPAMYSVKWSCGIEQRATTKKWTSTHGQCLVRSQWRFWDLLGVNKGFNLGAGGGLWQPTTTMRLFRRGLIKQKSTIYIWGHEKRPERRQHKTNALQGTLRILSLDTSMFAVTESHSTVSHITGFTGWKRRSR